MSTLTRNPRSLGDLTRSVFGESLTIDQAFERLGIDLAASRVRTPTATPPATTESLWVGSIGYERYKLNTDFAAQLRGAGVERLIDVRQLPISRRRGYAKSALAAALPEYGIEYLHMRSLGNPKPTRDLYKSGHIAEGRAGYEQYLLGEQRDALDELLQQLSEKRCALMCVEHESAVCHRDVIFSALRDELGLELAVTEIG
jgi:uncharacterized protein (DUF488 family)